METPRTEQEAGLIEELRDIAREYLGRFYTSDHFSRDLEVQKSDIPEPSEDDELIELAFEGYDPDLDNRKFLLGKYAEETVSDMRVLTGANPSDEISDEVKIEIIGEFGGSEYPLAEAAYLLVEADPTNFLKGWTLRDVSCLLEVAAHTEITKITAAQAVMGSIKDHSPSEPSEETEDYEDVESMIALVPDIMKARNRINEVFKKSQTPFPFGE